LKLDVEVASVETVMLKLKTCIQRKLPFSLIRFGDGGLKLIYYFLVKEKLLLEEIGAKEGIPPDKFPEVLREWTRGANAADFIDTPAVYFNKSFWPRVRKSITPIKPETAKLLLLWYELYCAIGIRNESYCNPEVNFLSCLRELGDNSLPSVISKLKTLLCITTYDRNALSAKFGFLELDAITVPLQYQNHYKIFNETMEQIRKRASCDLCLVAAGELGRIYTSEIKRVGGRAFDIGSLVDYWMTGDIPVRLQPFIQRDTDLFVKFTPLGRTYASVLRG